MGHYLPLRPLLRTTVVSCQHGLANMHLTQISFVANFTLLCLFVEYLQECKKLVTSDQVLTHYDPGLPVRLACDASPYGIGAVLSHVMPDSTERPIAFASRSLISAEQAYAQIDKEALALVWGVKHFNHYLYGRRFQLVTDHKPLTFIFHPERGIPGTAAARLQRWAIFLSGHDYVIVRSQPSVVLGKLYSTA